MFFVTYRYLPLQIDGNNVRKQEKSYFMNLMEKM